MPKSSGSDRGRTKKELQRIIKNFNRRVGDAQKRAAAHPEERLHKIIPAKINGREFLKDLNYASNKQIKEVKSRLQEFNRSSLKNVIKGEKGAAVTQWEYGFMDYLVNKVINPTRKKELNRLVKIYPELKDDRKNVMGKEALQQLAPKSFNLDKMRQTEFREFEKSVIKQSGFGYQEGKAETYKQRYLDAIDKYLGNHGKELHDYVKTLPANFVFDHYYEDDILKISFTSDPIPAKNISDQALQRWQNAIVAYTRMPDNVYVG